MKLYLGIDGGGTKTMACVANEEGHIVARSTAGVGNPNHISDADLQTGWTVLVNEAFKAAGATADDCVSVFAGVAGVTCESSASRIRSILERCGLAHAAISVDHDIRIALAGGLAGRPGMALIVGTGSSCYGRDADGNTWQTGGWGALIDDVGSGYFLGVRAITAAARMEDGRLPRSPLGQAVFEWLGIPDITRLLSRIHEGNLSRPEIAAFAPTVLQLAANNDPAAVDILESGAAELAKMVSANHAKLPTSPEPELVITGGLGTADSPYRPLIEREILAMVPGIQITAAELAPAAGAALLAIESVGALISSTVVSNLKGNSS